MSSLGWVAITILGVALAGACTLVYHLLVQNGAVLLRLEALERQLRERDILAQARDFALPTLAGETMALSQWRGRWVLLIFVHPGCGFSALFLDQLAPLAKSEELAAAPLFVSRGDAEENRRWFEQHGVTAPVLLQEGSEVSSMFGIRGTPSGWLLNEEGATVGEILVGADALVGALWPAGAYEPPGSLEKSRIPRNGLQCGTPAPSFTLPSLTGEDVSLNDYRGRRVLLVFSDPGCQPCNRVAQELERVHRRSKALQVLMISRGDRVANEQKAAEYGLTYPIVLQRHWEISKAYALFATPVGYLIDEMGVITSSPAVGADPILELAGLGIHLGIPDSKGHAV